MKRYLAGAVLFILAACARIAEPPGGPPDTTPPKLVSTFPDSMISLPGFDDWVEFRFDEIVNEGTQPNFGLGTGDLEKLVVLSPTSEVPQVQWKRNRIVARPRDGWQPNRVYRIELLEGIADLRNNRSQNGRIVTFTTGAPLPTRFLHGRVVDWTTSRPQALGLVEAILMPDSLTYRTNADSSGRFELGPLPDGEYVVAGVIDQNRNNRFDRRENFDTIRVAAGRDSVGELWAFRHDTVAARIQAVASNDSMSVVVTFNQHLSPYQLIPRDSVRVLLLPDSTPQPVDTVVTVPIYDSLFRRPPPRADSVPADSAARARAVEDSVRKARQDSVARADSLARARIAARRRPVAAPVDEGPLKTKPTLYDKVVVRMRERLQPGARYAVEVRGVESVSGVRGTAILGVQIPEAKPAVTDSTQALPDSAAVPPDTTRVRDTSGVRRR